MFAVDIMSVGESLEKVNGRLNGWSEVFEGKRL